MMCPVIRDISRKTGLAASKLYMPLSFASMLGGAMTLISTSVNLIIAGLVFSRTGEELNIFFPLLIGLPAAAFGLLFIMTLGTRLPPQPPRDQGSDAPKRRYRADFIVNHDSSLEDRTIAGTGLLKSTGYELVSIRRADSAQVDVDGTVTLKGGDMLEFVAEAEAVPSLWTVIGLEPTLGGMGSDILKPATQALWK